MKKPDFSDLDLKNPIHSLISQMRMDNYLIDQKYENEMAIINKMNKNDPTGNTARNYQRAIYGGLPPIYPLEYKIVK